MQNKKINFIFFGLLGLGLLFTSAANAQPLTAPLGTEATATSTTINASSTLPGQVLGLQMPAVPPIISQINLAKDMLNEIVLNHELAPVYKTSKNKKTGKTSKVITKYNLTNKDIALAILDPVTQAVTITVGRQNGKTMVFPDPKVDIKLLRFNGVNSRFSVNQPAGGTVLALKYLISKNESGSKAAIEQSLQPAVYVPYSDGLNSPEVISYGENYISDVIKKASGALQNTPSRAVPGKTIPEAIPPALIRALVYAEHTDAGSDLQSSINKLNILFALNQGDTYKYSVSTAGARGIAQFIPSTYAGLVQRHSEAGLTPDFIEGMSDHYNAIKAMYLLLDDYAGAVRIKASQGFSEGQVFDYGAASYNGGVTRVALAVNTYGTNWNQDQSAQIAGLNAQVQSLSSQSKSLKQKIKKTTDSKTRAVLQAQLKTTTQSLAEAKNQLSQAQSATLRAETVNYLKKIYRVIPYFNDMAI